MQLTALDNLLANKISQLKSTSLKAKLRSYSFINGYKNKEFIKLKATRLKQVISNWRSHHG